MKSEVFIFFPSFLIVSWMKIATHAHTHSIIYVPVIIRWQNVVCGRSLAFPSLIWPTGVALAQRPAPWPLWCVLKRPIQQSVTVCPWYQHLSQRHDFTSALHHTVFFPSVCPSCVPLSVNSVFTAVGVDVALDCRQKRFFKMHLRHTVSSIRSTGLCSLDA